MKHVRTEVLQPGMVVASDVISKGNQLIFPKGYVLTEKALARLETYDIRDIRIEDPVGIEVEEISEEELKSAEAPEIDSSVMTFATESLMSALTGQRCEHHLRNRTVSASSTSGMATSDQPTPPPPTAAMMANTNANDRPMGHTRQNTGNPKIAAESKAPPRTM